MMYESFFNFREVLGDRCNFPFEPTRRFANTRAHYNEFLEFDEDLMFANLWYGYAGIVDYKKFIDDLLGKYKLQKKNKLVEFMEELAKNVGTIFEMKKYEKKIGVERKTLRRWLDILEEQKVVYILKAYRNETLGRAKRGAKIYFLDTGLLAYLTDYSLDESIMLEDMAIGEIVKSYWKVKKEAPIFYYENDYGTKIEVVYDDGYWVMSVQIKNISYGNSVTKRPARLLERIENRSSGVHMLICRVNENKGYGVSRTDRQIPYRYI